MSEPGGSRLGHLGAGVRSPRHHPGGGQGRGRRRARAGHAAAPAAAPGGRAMAAPARARDRGASARTSRTCCPPPARSCCARATRSRSRHGGGRPRPLREPQRAAGRAPGGGPRLAAGDRRRRGASARIPRRVRVPGRALSAATRPAGPSRALARRVADHPPPARRPWSARPGSWRSGRSWRFTTSRSSALLPFPPLRFGWGLDQHWSALALEHGWRIGVVDATPIRHGLRRIAASYDRERGDRRGPAIPRRPPVHRRRATRSGRWSCTGPGREGPGRRRVLPAGRRPGRRRLGPPPGDGRAGGRRRGPRAGPAPPDPAAVGGPLGPDRPRGLAVVAQPRRAQLDGIEVEYVRYLSPPRPLSYRSWGAWAAPLLGPRDRARPPQLRVRPDPRPLRGPRRGRGSARGAGGPAGGVGARPRRAGRGRRVEQRPLDARARPPGARQQRRHRCAIGRARCAPDARRAPRGRRAGARPTPRPRRRRWSRSPIWRRASDTRT